MTPRWFIGLRQHQNDWVVNLLRFDNGTVHQFNTWCGEQVAPYDRITYDDTRERLIFVPLGQPHQDFQMVEISDSFGTFLTDPDKWRKLRHGLSIKSSKTMDWLQERVATHRIQIGRAHV